MKTAPLKRGRFPFTMECMHFYVRAALPLFLAAVFFGLAFENRPLLAAETQPLSADRRADLERELAGIEQQIERQRQILSAKQRESVSLERDVAILTAKIDEAKLSIRARDLAIQRLSQDINSKASTIGKLSDKLERERDSLAQLIRKSYMIESYSLPEFVLGNQSLSDFFTDIDTFQTIKVELRESSEEVTKVRSETQEEKETLEGKRAEQLELRRIQELQKKKIEEQEAEKRRILKASKGIEREYQRILSEQEKNAAFIRSQLFQLEGTVAIPFGKALEYATEASKKTGVRPALILGILTVESNLGENQGTGNWRADMAQRDWADFQSITRKLGLDPDKMPVSARPCSKAERTRLGPGVPCGYGWGGAMGPSQFIPSTWLLYENRVASVSGSNPPNPWNPRDAIFATGLLLKDNGAARGTRASERLAALRYLAGWKNAEKPSFAFYGNEVMDYADQYQAQIDVLNR